MAQGFFARFTRSGRAEAAEERAERAAAVPEGQPPSAGPSSVPIAEIAQEIARQGLPATPRKAAISLRLDADVLEWFRTRGPGYQTRINAVLRAYKEAAEGPK